VWFSLKKERESCCSTIAFVWHNAHTRSVSQRTRKLDSELDRINHQRHFSILSRSFFVFLVLLYEQRGNYIIL